MTLSLTFHPSIYHCPLHIIKQVVQAAPNGPQRAFTFLTMVHPTQCSDFYIYVPLPALMYVQCSCIAESRICFYNTQYI